MPSRTGTLSLDDLRSNRFQSAAEFGLDTINEVLQSELAYLNTQVQEQMAALAEVSSDTQRIYGVGGALDQFESDEFTLPPTQKLLEGVEVAFPLRKYTTAIGWTTDYLNKAPVGEVAEQYIRARTGYVQRLQRDIRRAIYSNANYTWVDVNGPVKIPLGVKRFLNADGSDIPPSPGGQTFDGATHTHYVARLSTLAPTDVDALVANVTEHGNTRGIKIVIALADKATIMGLTGFVPLGDGGIVYNATDTTVRRMDFDDLEDQLIGYWKNTSVEIWVKPWGLANYWLCYSEGATEKPLVMRVEPQQSLRGFRMEFRYPGYPLVSDNFVALDGFGVWNRTAGAVLYIGATSWSNPSGL